MHYCTKNHSKSRCISLFARKNTCKMEELAPTSMWTGEFFRLKGLQSFTMKCDLGMNVCDYESTLGLKSHVLPLLCAINDVIKVISRSAFKLFMNVSAGEVKKVSLGLSFGVFFVIVEKLWYWENLDLLVGWLIFFKSWILNWMKIKSGYVLRFES